MRVDPFWSKVHVRGATKCWPYREAGDKDGYGLYRVPGGGKVRAHRYAFAATNGRIPRGLWVCHRCDNPACCNPRHLFLGDAADNHADMVRKGRRAKPAARLSPDDVRAIRAAYAAGDRQADIAPRFGVCQVTVSQIVRCRTWADVQ